MLGGMGFTWEHDAHLHLRRAATTRQLLGGADARRISVARQAIGGVRRSLAVELPEDVAGPLRIELRLVVAEVAAAAADDQGGCSASAAPFPHWPAPYGRDAGPVEQLVIDQLLQPRASAVRRPMSRHGHRRR